MQKPYHVKIEGEQVLILDAVQERLATLPVEHYAIAEQMLNAINELEPKELVSEIKERLGELEAENEELDSQVKSANVKVDDAKKTFARLKDLLEDAVTEF